MAYCTKEQVADEFNGVTFGSSTIPTATTVDRWIEEADAIINAKVGLRYSTPITAAVDLIVIRQIAILLVSARVRRRLNRTGPDGETAKVKITDTHDQAMKMLDSISKGMTLLTGSTLANEKVGVSSFTAANADVDAAADDITSHQFKKNVDQW